MVAEIAPAAAAAEPEKGGETRAALPQARKDRSRVLRPRHAAAVAAFAASPSAGAASRARAFATDATAPSAQV